MTPALWQHRLLSLAVAAAFLAIAPSGARADFDQDLARIDKALKTNPSRVIGASLESCLTRRNFAVQLQDRGHYARAQRSLDFCFKLLDIPAVAPLVVKKVAAPKEEDLQAKATAELEKALTLDPNVANGLAIYRECAGCHMPEGWGLTSGSVPQIAGQLRNVIIKQLADIRAGNRDAVLMVPYSSAESIGGPQAVADVAAYIDTLEISVGGGKGKGKDLELGERLYRENCVECHGENGEGNNDEYVPRIHSQHFKYLVRQFEWIRDGKRRNSNPEMAAQIQGFEDRETRALLDYVSRLTPPPELTAPANWKNPDFAD